MVVSSFACSSSSIGLDERLGICTSVSNHKILEDLNCSYIEVNICDFYVPEKSDEDFSLNKKKLQDVKIPIYAANCFFPGSLKLVGDSFDKEKIVNYTEIAMRRANEVGTKIFVLGSGSSRKIPDNFNRDTARKQFVSICRDISLIAEKYDIYVVLEPLRREETNFVNTVKEGLEIVKEVDHPHFKILADFYHMLSEKESAEVIIEAGSDLLHCHIAEMKGRKSPGINGENFISFFKALKQINYNGALSLECNWESFSSEVVIGVNEVRRQINLVNK